MKLQRVLPIIVFGIIVMMMSCGGESNPKAESELSIFVSISPQVNIVTLIAGSKPVVHSLVKSGQSPATYDPTPKQIAQLAEADICFLIGAPFERGLFERASSIFESIKIVASHEGILLRTMAQHDHDAEIHTENGTDPHVWLSPLLMKKIASNMTYGLQQVDPTNSELYMKNLEQLQLRLDTLHTTITKLLAPFAGDTMYVYHPSYGYFADEYNLTQVALEPEGKEADANYLVQLMSELETRNVSGIFVQPQFSDRLARSVASRIGTKVVVLDPLAEDYCVNMLDIAHKVAQVLSSSRPGNK